MITMKRICNALMLIILCMLCLIVISCSNQVANEREMINPEVDLVIEPQEEQAASKINELIEPEQEIELEQEIETEHTGDEISEPMEKEQVIVAEEPVIEHVDKKENLPKGFVYLDEIIPNAHYEMRYYSEYNFVGKRIEGYLAPYAIATTQMAKALSKVSEKLEPLGYQLLIYDTYRPAKAVKQFIDWSQDTDDDVMKAEFYPNMDKADLFKQGYLSKKSGHSRGSTVDLTLVDSNTGEEVDMGSPYDLLDEISHFSTDKITAEQADNRQLLKDVMVKYGFKAYSKEWWHFVLQNEPYPNTYFDFDIE